MTHIPILAPMVFSLCFYIHFLCCNHNVLIFSLEKWEHLAVWLNGLCNACLCPLLQCTWAVLHYWTCWPLASAPLLQIMPQWASSCIFFSFQLFPWDNFPGTTLLNPELWMISTALDNRLSKCPANCGQAKRENVKLEESQVPTIEKQPNKIWRSHAQNTRKLLKEHWQGLFQYVKMCPLASQGS